MRDPHNLVAIHRASQAGAGRRHRQTTLNRAVVVLTAAAWQAYVAETTRAILHDLEVPHGTPGHAQFAIVRAAAKGTLKRFNTADSRNCLNLFLEVGFDPTTRWTFSFGTPPRHYVNTTVRDEIDDWLKVRHAVAHGAELPNLAIITGSAQNRPSMRLSDAERCIKFFEEVVRVTAAAAHTAFP